jgi:hypothetical protein
MVTTGFIGLFAMDQHMVRHLLEHKFEVSVNDTSLKHSTVQAPTEGSSSIPATPKWCG